MSQQLLTSIFQKIYEYVNKNKDINEEELYSILDKSAFFETLGYKQIGVDIRKQYTIINNKKRPDYLCYDNYNNVIFVIECKKPLDEDFDVAIGQLWDRYVLPLKSNYGILTNGLKIEVYERLPNKNRNTILVSNLKDITDDNSIDLLKRLQKPKYELRNIINLESYYKSIQKISLDDEVIKNYFLQSFQFEETNVFGELVLNFLDLFNKSYNESDFLKGAYSFWKNSLARKPEKEPKNWKPFLDKKNVDIYKLMFCLETSHVLLARLILAKACEDAGFPGINISTYTLNKIPQVRNNIPLIGYPIALINLLKEMRDQLIYSIFEEDIFSWWSDIFKPHLNKTSIELQNIADNDIDNFSSTIAKLMFIIYKFDFSKIEGDPLGDLYQQYFDKDTRKALGEFYTPVEVVDFILDNIQYRNITNRRLIDPACGSGTFLVEALKIYLKESEKNAAKTGWTTILRDLCNQPKIVGLDIHPFACLIAQIRFMLELIPYYIKAIEEDRGAIFESLQRLPIFRTDSLIKELIPSEYSKATTLTITEEDISFNVILPISISDRKVVMEICIPSWRKTSVETLNELYTLDEYFCVVQAIFDSIKSILIHEGTEVKPITLETQMKKYLVNKDFKILSNFFITYTNKILSNIIYLQSDIKNGRLIKSIEDAVLSSLLKNYIRYDFVVGNPPYVRIHLISSENKKYYKKMYESPSGKYDLYIIFIERGVQWLNDVGKLGYITSNMFMKRDYGDKIRNYILKNTTIKNIIDFGVSGVFKDATNYPCIFILENKRNNDNKIKYARVSKSKIINNEDITVNIVKSNIEKEIYEDKYIDIFEYKQTKLNYKPWNIMPNKEEILFDIMSKNIIRMKYINENIYRAIQTGYDEAYIIDENIIKNNNLEQELIKRILKGANNVERWITKWDGKCLIFPYEIENNKLININLDKYENTKKYLLKYEKEILSRQWYGKKILESGRQWFELWNPIIFNKPKIVVPEISTGKCFAYDNTYYCAGKVFSIFLKEQNNVDFIYYILALLNSDVLDFYYKHIASVKQGYYYESMENPLEELPIKMPDGFNEVMINEIINKVKIVIQVKEKIININEFPKYYNDKYCNDETEYLQYKITFSKKEKKVKYELKNNFGEYVINIDKSDEIKVNSEFEANYIIAWIKTLKSVDKEIEYSILMPKSETILKKIMTDYDADNSYINRNNYEEIEKEVNKIIFELYNLQSISSQDIIYKYLSKFSH